MLSISNSTIEKTTIHLSPDVDKSAVATPFPGRHLLVFIASLALIALGITGYLGYVALTSSKIAGCSGGELFNCGDVIGSRYSRWLGIPVSVLAFGLYGLLLGSLVITGTSAAPLKFRRLAWWVATTLGLSAGLAAMWFIGLQIFVVKHLCSYCLAAHGCGLIISATLLWKNPLGGTMFKYCGMLSLAAISVVIAGQIMFKPLTYEVIEYPSPDQDATGTEEPFDFAPPEMDDPPGTDSDTSQSSNDARPVIASRLNVWLPISSLMTAMLVYDVPQDRESSESRQVDAAEDAQNTEADAAAEPKMVSVAGGKFRLEAGRWPMIGPADAKYILVEMFDYTCDHCRRTHSAIGGARNQLGDELAIIALPVPLNTRCNSAVSSTGATMREACEISKLAVAVWLIDSTKFEEFHGYLMTTPSVVTYANALSRAEQIVDPDSLRQQLADSLADKYIARHVELYRRVGAGSVPKIFFPGTSVVGEMTSAQRLVEMIRQQFKD